MEHCICPICGYDENEGSECQVCKAVMIGEQAETKLKEGTGSYTFNKRSPQAKLYLTNQRFTMIPLKLEGYGVKGKLTAAIVNKMREQCTVISIPLKEIKSVESVRVGLLGRASLIEKINGETIKFQIWKQKEWRSAIKQAMEDLT